MRIVAVRDTVAPIASAIRNAYIDFSQMTASVVAVVTDVIRNDRPVVGYGLDSNGRYAQSGLLCEHGWSARRYLPHGGHQLSPNIAAGLQLGGNKSKAHLYRLLRELTTS